ncbi:isochorismatase [Pseudoclavibacter sp. RFBG4]|uniref:isochorismatase family protein n=1 Tax=Pseudoclavibacter sp. RFBG4 TaxID=2080575 RepID=UPI000CE87922|nr:isochorismatase family protein [Pseudoclavibacter sp. RFBG4]PPG28634.1 isochorismatase [Pseudoclavibacter sp. RFBG4]
MTTPRRALILVDVQQQYFSGPLEIHFPPVAESLTNITAAIDAATASGIPIVAVQHTAGNQAPVFNPTTPEFALHPKIADRQQSEWKSVVKQYSSVFAGTDLLPWLQEQRVDTVTFVGYMTNNCIIASSAAAEELNIAAEVLSDATGAINIANSAGFATAETVHTTLMTLLQSNFAAVSTTEGWTQALKAGEALPKGNLPSSAMYGAELAARQ